MRLYIFRCSGNLQVSIFVEKNWKAEVFHYTSTNGREFQLSPELKWWCCLSCGNERMFNPFYIFSVHVYDEYLANGHEYEIVQSECVHEYVAQKKFLNAREDDAYRYACVNEYGLSLYEDGDVNVFH